ncbi:hypothetical protein STHERM_c01800 [Spirochaeta thermophila DSM 6192]|uniref:Uncharacterized protein n=2 Tax=Winmispira thermophila TaxID=154 RepID=E0RNF4_WINT6|nr:hypothetical protein STHERM_c01800 [Spirochaeta thermophila DSM 6192]
MKRGLMLLLALTVVASLAFAETSAQVEYSISGSATSTVGYDLDGKTFGIKNETSADLTITFVEGTEEKGGDGPVYGWIKLEGFSAKAGNNIVEEDVVLYDADGNDITEDVKSVLASSGVNVDSIKAKSDFVITPPSITAKLMMGPAYLLITTKDTDVNKASLEPDYIKEEAFGGSDVSAVSLDEDDNTLTFGVDVDMVSASVTLGSNDDWNGSNENAGLISGEVSVNVAPVSLGVKTTGVFGKGGKSIGEDANNPLILGADLAVSVDASGISITPAVAYDFIKKGDESAQEVKGGVSVSYSGLSAGVDTIYVLPAEKESRLLVKGSVSEPADGGVVPVAGFGLKAEYGMSKNDNTKAEDSAMALTVDLDAALGVARPYAGVIYEQDLGDDATTDDAKTDLMIKVGTDITVVPNTTFTLQYASGDLTHEESVANYTADVYTNDSGARLGEITFAIKISY